MQYHIHVKGKVSVDRYREKESNEERKKAERKVKRDRSDSFRGERPRKERDVREGLTG